MSIEALDPEAAWVPGTCTLPAQDRPPRVAEFDDLFATSLRGLGRYSPTGLWMDLDPTPETAARAAALVMRETGCCSFFIFALVAAEGALTLDVRVPDARVDVLDALASRAAAVAALPG
ncbi:hypothetical protein [Actinokineospora alba]|nr:hypothetical protein [Actinokineospora alba]